MNHNQSSKGGIYYIPDDLPDGMRRVTTPVMMYRVGAEEDPSLSYENSDLGGDMRRVTTPVMRRRVP